MKKLFDLLMYRNTMIMLDILEGKNFGSRIKSLSFAHVYKILDEFEKLKLITKTKSGVRVIVAINPEYMDLVESLKVLVDKINKLEKKYLKKVGGSSQPLDSAMNFYTCAEP
jgi:hypothetical protein